MTKVAASKERVKNLEYFSIKCQLHLQQSKKNYDGFLHFVEKRGFIFHVNLHADDSLEASNLSSFKKKQKETTKSTKYLLQSFVGLLRIKCNSFVTSLFTCEKKSLTFVDYSHIYQPILCFLQNIKQQHLKTQIYMYI